MAGLAAAHALNKLEYDVELYERQPYETKRVNCGEAMTVASTIPLEKTPENGFVNHTPAFEVQVYTGTDAPRRLAGKGTFSSGDGYVTDRNVVERRWADHLTTDGVTVHANHSVTKPEFRSLVQQHDLIVDATGQPSITSKVTGRTAEYSGYMTALNADVEGDFTDLYPNARMVLENYAGYAWAFPKTPERANVGIGWAQRDLPEDYMTAFQQACERNGWPIPSQDQTNVAIIPQGPSLDPSRLYVPEQHIVRVGDAAGIANRFSGKGISQAVHSSYLMARHAATDSLAEYPAALHRTMRPEYLLAYVVRGVLEVDRPDLLGRLLDAVSGLDVEDVDRAPRNVLKGLLRHPIVLSRLLSTPSILQRAYDAYADNWEYRLQSD
jgi:digeranylgeranylglycerophospholipid reductase